MFSPVVSHSADSMEGFCLKFWFETEMQSVETQTTFTCCWDPVCMSLLFWSIKKYPELPNADRTLTTEHPLSQGKRTNETKLRDTVHTEGQETGCEERMKNVWWRSFWTDDEGASEQTRSKRSISIFSLFCIAHYHKLLICPRGFYNLYTYSISDLWPHIGSGKTPKK